MKFVSKTLVRSLVEPVVLGLSLFVAAGTFGYWQAWVFLAVAALTTAIPTALPAAQESRRARAADARGPDCGNPTSAEGAHLGLVHVARRELAVSALDHRFGWSSVPTVICVVGDVLVAVALGVMMLVVMQNSHAAATVRVEADQRSSQPVMYGLVRHPMYTGNVIMLIGIPLALGSYWGLGLSGAWPCRARGPHPRRGEAAFRRSRRLPGVHRKFGIAWCRHCGSRTQGTALSYSSN